MLPIDTQFDVSFANDIARLESYNKHHYRPNSYLHKWWARRCGSTFRLILKQLAPDAAARDYYAPGGLEGRIILDPMMGGGTTLHEAIRLGANVIGADIDPIPVLQLRASLSRLSLHALEQAYRHFHRALRAELDPLYETHCPACDAPTQLRYLLYGLRRRCACGEALLVDSFTLRQEGDGSTVCLDPATHAVCLVGADGQHGVVAETAVTPRLPLYDKRTRSCPCCHGRFVDDRARPYYARYVPLVVVGRCAQHGRFFRPPAAADLALLARADAQRAALPFDAAAFAIEPGRKSRQLISKGIDSYLALFSSRQLQLLAAAARLLPAYEPLVRLNLALLVSTSLEFNSMLCGYKGAARRRAGAIRHTFSHHAYAFPHTALENNPLFRKRASGTLHKLFQARIVNGREWAQQPRERKIPGKTAEFVPILGEEDAGEETDSVAALQQGSRRFLLMQGSSAALALPDGSVDAIVTDPPYFDSVQYSDLAAFFRVWLRQLLPDAAEWGYDVGDSAVDPHKNDRESRYAELLAAIFAECRRVLRPEGGRFIFTFHHWNPKGWAALTLALRRAGFVLLNRYVVHAENPVSVHINNMNALLHDAILVLAPAGTAGAPAWERPLAVDSADSEAFTHDCATLLGWLLSGDLPEDAVQRAWREALA